MSILYIILVAIYIASVVGCTKVCEATSPSRDRFDRICLWLMAIFWPIVALLVFVFEALRGKSSSKSGKFH